MEFPYSEKHLWICDKTFFLTHAFSFSRSRSMFQWLNHRFFSSFVITLQSAFSYQCHQLYCTWNVPLTANNGLSFLCISKSVSSIVCSRVAERESRIFLPIFSEAGVKWEISESERQKLHGASMDISTRLRIWEFGKKQDAKQPTNQSTNREQPANRPIRWLLTKRTVDEATNRASTEANRWKSGVKSQSDLSMAEMAQEYDRRLGEGVPDEHWAWEYDHRYE